MHMSVFYSKTPHRSTPFFVLAVICIMEPKFRIRLSVCAAAALSILVLTALPFLILTFHSSSSWWRSSGIVVVSVARID